VVVAVDCGCVLIRACWCTAHYTLHTAHVLMFVRGERNGSDQMCLSNVNSVSRADGW
jgi:hypothetical protein